MPEPSEPADTSALSRENALLKLQANRHFVELTRLAETYNLVVEYANRAAKQRLFNAYSISDYLTSLPLDLTEQPQKGQTTSMRDSQIFSLIAYRTDSMGMFAFDDPAVGLKRELFVPSASEVLNLLARLRFGEERDSFAVVFSARLFEGFQARAKKATPAEDARLREKLGIDFDALTKYGRYVITRGGEGGGTYYRINLVQTPVNSIVQGRDLIDRTLWLCDALRMYFAEPPAEIYVRVTDAEEACELVEKGRVT